MIPTIPDDIAFDIDSLDYSDEIAVRFNTYVRKKFGSITIERGTANGRPIIMGDVMPLCRKNCKLRDERCKPPPQGGVCTFISAPMKKTAEFLFRHYFDLDDMSLLDMGLVLVPLYVEYHRRRLDLMENPVNEQEKGGKRSNPSLNDMVKLTGQIMNIRKLFDKQLEKQKPVPKHGDRYSQRR